VVSMNDGPVRRSYCSSRTVWDRAALDCLTVSYCCRGRWSLTTARSHLPDSPPEFTAWDCSPLLPFATCAGLDRTARIYRGRLLDAKAAVPLGLSACGKLCYIMSKILKHYAGTLQAFSALFDILFMCQILLAESQVFLF